MIIDKLLDMIRRDRPGHQVPQSLRDLDRAMQFVVVDEQQETAMLAKTRATLLANPGLRPVAGSMSASGPRPTVARTRSTLTTVALFAVYGILGHAFAYRTFVIVLLFVIVPGVAVLGWHLQARRPHHFISFLRTPRRAAEWSDEIKRQIGILDVRAAELSDLLQRIHLIASDVAAERRVCENHGLVTVASKLVPLGHLLQEAIEYAENLTKRVAEGTEEARRFTASCRRDPLEASLEYGRLPLLLDPARIGAVIDDLVIVLRLTTEVAVDIPLHIQGRESRISTVQAGKISTTVASIFREAQGSSRSLKHEFLSMLRAFDVLHGLVTTESIATLKRGLAPRTTARVAVAATVLTQPRVRRWAARTAFLREAAASSSQSWVWIVKATVAAFTEGQKSLVS